MLIVFNNVCLPNVRQDMKIPSAMVKFMKKGKIVDPTPIQLQGIPTA